MSKKNGGKEKNNLVCYLKLVTFAAEIINEFDYETKKTTFNRPSHEEVREMFRRAKARQQELEEKGRRMWEEEQKIKAEAKKYYELEFA